MYFVFIQFLNTLSIKIRTLLGALFLLVTRTGIIAFSPEAKTKGRLGLSCCGVRHLPASSVLLGSCRPRPLAQVAYSATGGAPIAPPRRQRSSTLHLDYSIPYGQKIHHPKRDGVFFGDPYGNRTHKAVKAVQKRLFALGYTEVGEADGIAGAKFTAAVKHFQKDKGCWVDGVITAKNKTWKKLLGMI